MPEEALEANGTSGTSPATLDARSLRALAHPMRVQILDILDMDGPETATTLADRLGVRTGTTSWHLLKLAEHGLVEEIPDRGAGRERWWRSRQSGWSINSGDFLDDAELSDATEVLLSSVIAQQLLRATRFVQEDWPKRWRQAWILTTDQTLKLDPDALAAMRADLWAVIERYRNHPSTTDDAELVVFQMQGFPHRSSSDL